MYICLLSHQHVRNKTEDRRVQGKAIRGRAAGLGDLEDTGHLGDDSRHDATDDLIDDAVRERRTNHEKQKSSNEGGLGFTTEREHLYILSRRKCLLSLDYGINPLRNILNHSLDGQHIGRN